jgi:hypothetical protein
LLPAGTTWFYHLGRKGVRLIVALSETHDEAHPSRIPLIGGLSCKLPKPQAKHLAASAWAIICIDSNLDRLPDHRCMQSGIATLPRVTIGEEEDIKRHIVATLHREYLLATSRAPVCVDSVPSTELSATDLSIDRYCSYSRIVALSFAIRKEVNCEPQPSEHVVGVNDCEALETATRSAIGINSYLSGELPEPDEIGAREGSIALVSVPVGQERLSKERCLPRPFRDCRLLALSLGA